MSEEITEVVPEVKEIKEPKKRGPGRPRKYPLEKKIPAEKKQNKVTFAVDLEEEKSTGLALPVNKYTAGVAISSVLLLMWFMKPSQQQPQQQQFQQPKIIEPQQPQQEEKKEEPKKLDLTNLSMYSM